MKSFSVIFLSTTFAQRTSIELLPNDRVAVALYNISQQDKIIFRDFK
ncbi:MAG: hypothetical protein WKF89_01035 [Chitinophagaceae bacterium]